VEEHGKEDREPHAHFLTSQKQSPFWKLLITALRFGLNHLLLLQAEIDGSSHFWRQTEIFFGGYVWR